MDPLLVFSAWYVFFNSLGHNFIVVAIFVYEDLRIPVQKHVISLPNSRRHCSMEVANVIDYSLGYDLFVDPRSRYIVFRKLNKYCLILATTG